MVRPDLEAVQRLANVTTRSERDANKQTLSAQLQALATEHPWLAPAVHHELNDAIFLSRCCGSAGPSRCATQVVLAELQANTTLPPDLAALRDFILSTGTKAEQEGWL